MLEYFPPQKGNPGPFKYGPITERDLRHYTEDVDVAAVSSAERISTHYSTLLRSSLKMENAHKGEVFGVCIYDALVAASIGREHITVKTRARERYKDDIDCKVGPEKRPIVCLYFKTSIRERWKQVDRDALIAKEEFGQSTILALILYSEHGLEGFAKDCAEPERVSKEMEEREEWARSQLKYIALSQVEKFNALVADIKRRLA